MYKNNKRYGRYNNNSRGRRAGGFRIKSFDPSRIIGRTQDSSLEEEYLVKHSFEDFKIDTRLKDSIARRNYKTPTPIQDQAIPEILAGRDVVGISNTGTGKTAAFLIPLIDKIFNNSKSRVLIVAPTRELALQIETELRAFNKHIPSVVCIGGVNIQPQIRKLRSNPSFVIGTPGRLIDLFNQRKLNFSWFDSVVLDEVDRMLDMGFIHDVKMIINNLPDSRQSLFFSATLDEKIRSVMHGFLNDPVTITVKTHHTKNNIEQKIVKVNGRDKYLLLKEVLDEKTTAKSLVFVRTKRGADRLSRTLYSIGFKTSAMHGNKTQNQRQKSLELFKTGKVNILIATDVAARGIDVNDISHVINFDLPESREDYIHRIGRTGRNGKKGTALSFVG